MLRESLRQGLRSPGRVHLAALGLDLESSLLFARRKRSSQTGSVFTRFDVTGVSLGLS